MSAAATPAPRVDSTRARWMALAFAGALAIYAWGAAPSVVDRDSGELQAVAITGGVAHPTGYPLFTAVGRLFAVALPGDPARRINLMSAFFGALDVAVLVGVGGELGLTAPVAFAGAVLFGAGFSFWAAALRAEVYTLSVLVFLLAWWRTLIALRTGVPRHRVAAAFLLGLSLTGQLSCAPAALVLGAALAWRAARSGRTWREWPLLLGAALLGVTPYLWIPLAEARGTGLDSLHIADLVFFPGTGVPKGAFDTPWERLLWLVSGGRDLRPGGPEGLHLGEYLRNAFDGGMRVALFDLGPVVTLLLVPGAWRLWRRSRSEALRQLAMLAGSAVLAAGAAHGPLIAIFLIYSCAQLALVGALGLDALAARLAAGLAPRVRQALLVPALAVLAMAPAHALRLRAYQQPIPPGGWSALDEDGHRPLHLLWPLDDSYRFRDFGRAAMRVLPESSLVIGRWRELPILYYFRYALGERADLSYQPWDFPGLLIRARRWQEIHDLREHPIVFLTLSAELAPHLAAVDSPEVSRGYRLYLVRAPLVDLPTRRGERLDD